MKSKFSKAAKLIMLVLVAVFTVLSVEASAQAASYGTNGYQCTKKHLNTGIVVMGDSRTCQLWNYNNSGASFVSVWGGHYYGGTNSMSIDATARRTQLKTYINDTVSKKGYCNVYLFATVNDYNGGSGYQGAADKVVNLSKTVKGYNKKATVTVVGLVGGKGKNVSNYNTYLKKNLPSGVKWLSVADCLGGSNSGYTSDNLHYNNTTLKNIWKKIK